MRLALALGKFPGEIDQMPYVDYVELMEFYEIEPWGLGVHDAFQANAVQVLANVNRDPAQRKEPYRLKDFMLFAQREAARPETLVDGKNAQQWQLIFQAEAAQAARQNQTG